jgi:hypothetical protein
VISRHAATQIAYSSLKYSNVPFPLYRSIGIEVEFVREHEGWFVTVAVNEDGHTFERDRGRSLIDQRFGAYIEQQNRAAG